MPVAFKVKLAVAVAVRSQLPLAALSRILDSLPVPVAVKVLSQTPTRTRSWTDSDVTGLGVLELVAPASPSRRTGTVSLISHWAARVSSCLSCAYLDTQALRLATDFYYYCH
jgi:hypothetical protein